MANTNVRWAFKVSEWHPSLDDILVASSYIQPEEIERLSKYYYQNDAKSSLVGRLMLRKYVHIATNIPYEEIRFTRDERGKPYLAGVGDVPVSFNVSHQGDFVVLAGNTRQNIGIDVMRIEPPVNKDIPEFFRLMKRNLTDHEWSTVRRFPTEIQQMACFYRIWSLKEAYSKNLGYGIILPFDTISFNLKNHHLEMGKIDVSTELYADNVLRNDYVLEETLLDNEHTVAVALKVEDKANHVPTPYTLLHFEELVSDAKALHPPDYDFSTLFMKKTKKNLL